MNKIKLWTIKNLSYDTKGKLAITKININKIKLS